MAMTRPSIIIGIDPGKTGAVAVLREGELVCLEKCPLVRVKKGGAKDYDLTAMYGLLREYSDNAVLYIERVGAFPMSGRALGGVSMFSFGEGYGAWRMAAAALGIPCVLVRPQDWKHAVLKGTDHGKDASVWTFKRWWPDWTLKPGRTRADRVDDHNLAEAALIALYGANQVGAAR